MGRRTDYSGIRYWDGTVREYSFSARIGKHYCPYCNNLLQAKTKKRKIYYDSEEAKYYPTLGGLLRGYTEVKWDVFYCEKCDKDISIGDVFAYRRALEKAGGDIDFNTFLKWKDIPGNRINKVLGILLICLAFTAIILILVLYTLHK